MANAIGGGTINSVAVTFNPTYINLNADGSFTVGVTVNLNGTARARGIGVSADGLTFTLDGQPLTPWAALTQLGSALASAGPKVTAVFQAAGAVVPLTGP
jgi:hypothetical protein